VLDRLLVPVPDSADGSRPVYSQPKMRCLLDAAEDHKVVGVLS
jgi:hypothetical protein